MNKSNVIQFLSSRFCSALGDQFLLFAVPLIIYKSTQNVSMVGLAFLIEWTPRILSLPIAGTFSDRFGGKKVYLIADFARMAACLAGFLLINLFPENIFFITSGVMSICAFFYAQSFIAMESIVPKLIRQADLPKAQSILQSIEQGSSILGPAMAAILVVYIDKASFLLIAASVFGLSFLGVLLTGNSLNVKVDKPSNKKIWRDILQGARVLLNYPNLLTLTALSSLVNLIIGIALATGAVLTNGTFHKPDSYFGVLNTTAGLLALISFLIIPRLIKHFSLFNLGIVAYLTILCGGMLVGVANNFYLFVLGYALACGSSGMFNVYIRTERIQWIPTQHLGKTTGLIVLLNQLSLPAAGMLVTLGSGWLGTQSLFVFASLIAAGYLIWIYKHLKRNSKTRVSIIS